MAYDDGIPSTHNNLFSMLEKLTNLRQIYKTTDQIEETLEKKIKSVLEGRIFEKNDDDDDDHDDADDSPVAMKL